MNDSLSTVLLHVVKTLPDSISERKSLLVAIANLLTSKHPAFRLVQSELSILGSMEAMDQQLPLKFQK